MGWFSKNNKGDDDSVYSEYTDKQSALMDGTPITLTGKSSNGWVEYTNDLTGEVGSDSESAIAEDFKKKR